MISINDSKEDSQGGTAVVDIPAFLCTLSNNIFY